MVGKDVIVIVDDDAFGTAAECARNVARKRAALADAAAALEDALQLQWRAEARAPSDAEQHMAQSMGQVLSRRASHRVERATKRRRTVFLGGAFMGAIAAYVAARSADLADDYEGRELQLMEWADAAVHCDAAIRGAFDEVVAVETVAATAFVAVAAWCDGRDPCD